MMSFAGSGIPAFSKERAVVLIAAYHEICVQVVEFSDKRLHLAGGSLSLSRYAWKNSDRTHCVIIIRKKCRSGLSVVLEVT